MIVFRVRVRVSLSVVAKLVLLIAGSVDRELFLQIVLSPTPFVLSKGKLINNKLPHIFFTEQKRTEGVCVCHSSFLSLHESTDKRENKRPKTKAKKNLKYLTDSHQIIQKQPIIKIDLISLVNFKSN